jgi:hypothetical protein
MLAWQMKKQDSIAGITWKKTVIAHILVIAV